MRTLLNLKEYRGIVISTLMFLLLNTLVLMLNFYIPLKIKNDATDIYLAERQLTLLQNMIRNLFEINSYPDEPLILSHKIKDLYTATQLFNNTHNAFLTGGYTIDTQGNHRFIHAINTREGQALISKTNDLWAPFFAYFESFTNVSGTPRTPLFHALLDEAIKFSTSNNTEIATSISQLNHYLHARMNNHAESYKRAQTIAIILSIIIFLILLFQLLRQVKNNKGKTVDTEQDINHILNIAEKGIFLLDQHLTIGCRFSSGLSIIFGRDDFQGLPLRALLSDKLSENDIESAENLTQSLFSQDQEDIQTRGKVHLTRIECLVLTQDNLYTRKYLNFEFIPTISKQGLPHVWVTVTDITKQIDTEYTLRLAKSQNKQQLKVLSSAIYSNMESLDLFLKNINVTFHEIDGLLELSATQEQNIEKVNRISELINEFKETSSSLDLTHFTELADQFAINIKMLHKKINLTEDDFSNLKHQLSELTSHKTQYENLVKRLKKLSAYGHESNIPRRIKRFEWRHLEQLAQGVAMKQNKNVEIIYSGLNDYDFSESFLSLINILSTQLINNAIIHGIESKLERTAKNKKSTGLINIQLSKRQSGFFEYKFNDDGKGLDLNKILKIAIKNKIISSEKAKTLDKKTIVSLIFSPNFAPSNEANDDIGRGMFSVRNLIINLGGRISVSFKPGAGTTFTISLPTANMIQTEAV